MANRNELLSELEKKLNIKFKDIKYLEIALTHSSFANGKKTIEFNERLEFLGDSILSLCISEYLFKKYNDKYEGELTRLRSLIVCEYSLYEIARSWNMGAYLNMSKGEELTGGRERVSILADSVEALIAAVYLDAGFESAKEFVLTNFKSTIEKAIKNEIVLDYKTKLQEILQENGEVNIAYKLLKYEGPPHRRKFYSEVGINGENLGLGAGFSKKDSEQDAAHNALNAMENKNE
jgi:ribonuclease III